MKNLLIIIIFSISQILSAQDKEKKKKSIKDLTKSSQKIDGLFPIFQDSTSGELKMLVSEEQLNKFSPEERRNYLKQKLHQKIYIHESKRKSAVQKESMKEKMQK